MNAVPETPEQARVMFAAAGDAWARNADERLGTEVLADLAWEWLAAARAPGEVASVGWVQVRVAVVVGARGEYRVSAGCGQTDEDALGWASSYLNEELAARYILTATLPKPSAPPEIAATVEEAKP